MKQFGNLISEICTIATFAKNNKLYKDLKFNTDCVK